MDDILIAVTRSSGSEESGSDGLKRYGPSTPSVVLVPLTNRIGDISKTLKVISRELAAGLNELSVDPKSGFYVDEIELTLSISLEAEANVVIGKGKVGAGIDASLKWKRA